MNNPNTRASLITGALMMAYAISGTAQESLTSPSTTVAPYINSHLPNVVVESILTVDDGVVPKTGGGNTRLAGIPDGIGVIDGADLNPPDPGVFYLTVNHELNATQGVPRDHGRVGAFVSIWKVDKITHEVVEGDDLIKSTFSWDELTGRFVEEIAEPLLFDRFCSADLPPRSAIYNSATGLGSQEFIHINGEETNGGRAFGQVVTGLEAGNSYHLEHLGFLNHENILLNPFEQDTTVAAMMDDDGDGEVYFYVGQKQATGLEVEKAGLVGGDLYSLAVVGKPFEMDQDLSLAVDVVEPFTLKLIGTDGNRPVDGADTEARGADTLTPVDPTQVFESLKMGGPEDGVWDTRPGFENVFYFVTKGTESGTENAVTRLWALVFEDITNPALGGVMTLLLDGPANRLGSLDNMAFDVIGGQPKLYIQEDLGSDSRLSKIWEYDINTGQLEEIAQHDGQRFTAGGIGFLTTNEESSGIISLANILGEGWFASSVQVHTSAGLSNSDELVENGQLCLINIAGRGTDLLREQLIASGDDWNYRVDGVDPGADWNTAGFAIDGNWNVNTDGVATGPVPTMLGYGESSGRLNTDLVQPSSPRPAAYYFRREFDLIDPANIVLFDLYLKIDDGAVAYINGVEVARYNMAFDSAVDNGTFADRNEPTERDWKIIPINCEDLPLQATGNVLAISAHQENASSSDLRLDAELFAWNGSPDAGIAPAIPAGLAVGNATESELELTWDPQADAKFFRIERQTEGDVAWEVAEAELDGSFTSYVDGNLDDGVTYNYRISAVNIHGRSACSEVTEGTTVASLLFVIFEERFDADLGQFSVVDLSNPDAGWSWNSFGGGIAEGNGFGRGTGFSEDWLITTDPINFDFYENEQLFADIDNDFGGPDTLLQYSTDYDPAVNTDPNTATWVTIDTFVGPGGGSPLESFTYDISDIPSRAYLGFKYETVGPGGGESTRFSLYDITVAGDCGYDFEGPENGPIPPTTGWEVVNLSSAFTWRYDTYGGQQGAFGNNFASSAGGTTGGDASDDWLISPPFTLTQPGTLIEFEYYENFGDTLEQPLTLFVTDNYTGDPLNTAWTDITPAGLNGSTSDAWIVVQSAVIPFLAPNATLAFRYQSAGNGGGTTKRIGVDKICIKQVTGPLEAEFAANQAGAVVSFVPTIAGGLPPYQLDWDFGDGNTSTENAPVNTYAEPGTYTVLLTVTDADNTVVTVNGVDLVTVTEFQVPEKVGDLRIASFNASMNRSSSGQLAEDLAAGDDVQIQAVAEAIQRANPDVILVNEFDQIYDENGSFDLAATTASIIDFKQNYLEVSQAEGVDPVVYPYHFVAPCNTGVPTPFDLDNNGSTGQSGDAYGFGAFPGQFAMILLSKYPFQEDQIRTFQNFRWKDLPDALLPPDPNDSDNDGDTSSFYTAEELEIFRLSSKSHWDIPVQVRGNRIRLLCSHPTPPVFDDGTATVYPSPDVADWNGLRNHDEIRFWADYVSGTKAKYIYDDNGKKGGVKEGDAFMVLGDQNADPVDGDATFNPILLLLDSGRFDTSITPSSPGAAEQVPLLFDQRETKTASFWLRADYALPSVQKVDLLQAFVFWPETTDIEARVLGGSDHRLVAVDVKFTK